MIPEVQAIVDTIALERERFEGFCRSLSEGELRGPVPDSTWIVKDFVSHLATIDGPITAWFAAIADGGVGGAGLGSDTGAAWDVDRFNDARVAERSDRPLDAIFAEAARARVALVEALDRLTAEQVAGTIHFGGDSKRPPSDIALRRYLQGWARHDVIHVADMLKALPERRDDSPIAAWLAEPAVAAVIGMYQQAMSGQSAVGARGGKQEE